MLEFNYLQGCSRKPRISHSSEFSQLPPAVSVIKKKHTKIVQTYNKAHIHWHRHKNHIGDRPTWTTSSDDGEFLGTIHGNAKDKEDMGFVDTQRGFVDGHGLIFLQNQNQFVNSLPYVGQIDWGWITHLLAPNEGPWIGRMGWSERQTVIVWQGMAEGRREQELMEQPWRPADVHRVRFGEEEWQLEKTFLCNSSDTQKSQ